jgi:hypothetical protein
MLSAVSQLITSASNSGGADAVESNAPSKYNPMVWLLSLKYVTVAVCNPTLKSTFPISPETDTILTRCHLKKIA